MMETPANIYLFVVWHRGLPELDKVLATIGSKFTILKQYDVTWPRSHYIRNFAAFYGWRGWSMWFGKRNRVGTGSFRLIVVRDEHPEFKDVENRGLAETMRNESIYAAKMELRHSMKRSNAVHGSVNEAETRQNVFALFGQTLEEFVARDDLDGTIGKLAYTKPLAYHPYPYAEDNAKGPRFLDGCLKFNRVDFFLLPRCGIPTIFSFSFRIFGVFGFAFCLGAIKIWVPRKPQ